MCIEYDVAAGSTLARLAPEWLHIGVSHVQFWAMMV
jgi:hypothetical protein